MNLENYKLFFERLPVGAYVATPEGGILAANKAFASMLGYSSVEDILRRPAWEFYVERADREIWLTRLKAEGTVRNYEVPWCDKKGNILWVKNSAIATLKTGGGISYFEGVVENFTSLHDLQEVSSAHMATLRVDDEVYLQMLNTMRMPAVRKDRNHKFTFANQYFCQYEAQRPLSELLGKTDFDIYPKETAARYKAANERVMGTGKVFESTEEHRIARGEARFVHVIRAPIRDRGTVCGVQTLFWEEADQTAAMMQLSRANYRAADAKRILERHFRIVYEHDLKGRFLNVNEAGEEITGYSLEEFRNLSLKDIVAPEYLYKVQQYLQRKLTQGFENEITTYELDILAKDGRRIALEITSRLLFRDGAPVSVEGHGRDITNRRQEERARLKEIHHRVKNNLQVVSNVLASERIRASSEEVKSILLNCENRVRTMAFIHKELYEKHDLDRIDIAHYIKTLANHLVESYKREDLHVSVQTNIDEDLRLGLDTVVPLGLIINELISNALKHGFPTRQRDRDRLEKRHAHIRIGIHAEGDASYRLYVSDNGDGLPREFDPRMAKSLGIRLVYGVVEKQLRGKIELNRQGGTSFNIVLRSADYAGS